MKDFDVIVIGAGVIGSSIAFELSRRNQKVLVLEKANQPGAGSTGYSSAVLRQRYTNDALCVMAKEGLEAYSNWSEWLGREGVKSHVSRSGVLWLMQETKAELEKEQKRLSALGIETEVLNSSQVRERFPFFSLCQEDLDLTGEKEHACQIDDPNQFFLYEPKGGYGMDPVEITKDLLDAARMNGAVVEFEKEVSEAILKDGCVEGVKTGDGEHYHAPKVINAAGPWCARINTLFGAKHQWDLKPTRVQVCLRDTPKSLSGVIPVFGDGAGGIYGRAEAGGAQILFGSILPKDESEEVKDPDSFDQNADPTYREEKLHALHHRFYEAKDRGNVSGYAALYTVNRDDMHPILGPLGPKGFYIANGFSGHGFKLAPAVGGMMAKWVSGVSLPTDSKIEPEFLGVNRQKIAVKTKNVLA